MKPYNKYKSFKTQWLSGIPEHWETMRATVIFEERVALNKNYVLKNAFKFRFGEIVDKIQFGTTEELRETYEKYTIVDKNDIVVNGLNLNYDFVTQRVGLVQKKGIITSAYISMKPKTYVNPKYSCYSLKSMDNVKMLNGIGTGIRLTLSFGELKKQYFPIPPINEQDQIVKFLDYKTSKINKFIKEKKHEIELLKELKQAEINRVVTKGLDPNAKMKDSGIEWLGEIPEHWELKYLSQVCKEQTLSNKSEKNQNLLSLSYGKIINKDINTTEGLLPASFDTYQIVNYGNIILRLTDLQNDHKSLRTGLATQTGIITSAYTCIKPNNLIIPEYLHYLLHSFDICKVFYGMGGGLRQSIGFKEIRKLKILVPSINEQKSIVKRCKEITTNIENLIAGIEKEILLVQEFKTSLISEVVTGKIDIREVKIENNFELETIDESEVEEEVSEE